MLTGDTFGTAREQLKDSPCKIFLLTADKQAEQKEKYVLSLNPDTVIGIGNGHNDKLMMKACVIGIIVIKKKALQQNRLWQQILYARISLQPSICLTTRLDLAQHLGRKKAGLKPAFLHYAQFSIPVYSNSNLRSLSPFSGSSTIQQGSHIPYRSYSLTNTLKL